MTHHGGGLLYYIAHYFIARGLFDLLGHNWRAALVIGFAILGVLWVVRTRRNGSQRLRWRRERR